MVRSSACSVGNGHMWIRRHGEHRLDRLDAHKTVRGAADLRATNLIKGVVAGQRLAAENCAYAGARGLFKGRGAAYARQVLRQACVVAERSLLSGDKTSAHLDFRFRPKLFA